jgi:cell division protein FtsB
MSSTTHSPKKSHRGLALVALIFAAIVFGLLAGLGGSLLLTHSLIQRPLQEQQDVIHLQHIQHQQEVALLQQHLAEQNESIKQLKDELEYFIIADSTGYLKELASIQRENKSREEVFLQELDQLVNQVRWLENSTQEFNKTVENAKRELDRSDKSLRDDLQMLQSSLNDLKSKVQQVERQMNSR